ncbi:MAG: hypothetical protein AAFQ07_12740 [Chloroflexota bacterium]
MQNKALVNLFARHSQWWKVGVAFLFFVLMNIIILNQVSTFEALSGGQPLLELPNLAGQNLYDIANSYGAEALELYQYRIQPIDIVYPLTAGIFFTLFLSALTTRLFKDASIWRYAPLFGILAVLLDWAENLSVFVILRTLDNPINWLSFLTPALSIVKTIAGVICVVFILGMLGVWAFKKFSKE